MRREFDLMKGLDKSREAFSGLGWYIFNCQNKLK